MTAPITLYTAATPNGWKASITLEELGLAYDVTTPINIAEDGAEGTLVPEDQPERAHPGDRRSRGRDFAVFESGAILLYLAEGGRADAVRRQGAPRHPVGDVPDGRRRPDDGP